MQKLDLNGIWKLRQAGRREWIDAQVPGSANNSLLEEGLAPDPFFRDNEDIYYALAEHDYEFERVFEASEELLGHDRVLLRCEGLDTLASICINGVYAADTDNMHRTYEFDVKDMLVAGSNTINITFKSPLEYAARMHREKQLWGVREAVEGYPSIRKAHCMFGWDWGPQMPDCGIWRDIYIVGYSGGRLDDVMISQMHGEGRVRLKLRCRQSIWGGGTCGLTVDINCPDGKVLQASASDCPAEETISIDIEYPQLWWPAGMGAQPLYGVTVMFTEDGKPIDEKALRIGLRTMEVCRESDEWGEGFALCVNGVSVFARGANYIPEDSILSRRSREKTQRLIRDCVKANFNCLRVWGGGIYPDDWLYELCDEYGIIVWQDLMFACSMYDLDEAFADSISAEVRDNVRRIRHHACLGLWCGNNEIEQMWDSWDIPDKPEKLKRDYIKMFEQLLPDIVREEDPHTFYWPSSPSSGGGFAEPNGEAAGDAHNWDVWHGLAPFTDYRKHVYRFVSEFGFQSFPPVETIDSFTLPEDRNIFSYIMEKHQKNKAANGKILYYLSDNFKYPNDLESLVYASQLLQAEAMRCGVEHWRRNRGRCMGTLYWQLNDCWPVASWSGIDYYGRWKALHYFAKRFYAPVLISACDEGTKITLHVTNDTLRSFSGAARWSMRDVQGGIIRSGEAAADVPALSVAQILALELADVLKDGKRKRTTYFEYRLEEGGEVIGRGTALFTRVKHFEFLKPKITVRLEERDDCFAIAITSDVFAKYVQIYIESTDCVFSDNYFDVLPNEEYTVYINKAEYPDISLDVLKNKLGVKSIKDIE